MRLYTMYDSVAKKAGPVWESDTNGSAVRALGVIKFPPKTRANDFELICIGEINSFGEIMPCRDFVGTFPAEDVNE